MASTSAVETPYRGNAAPDPSILDGLAALAGDLPDFEEAARALFAGDLAAFAERMASWPADVSAYALVLAAANDQNNQP